MNHTASTDSATGNMAHSKLAVIAYSGRYPGAQTNEAFWEVLEQGRDVASKAPKTR
jgi:acyl transferase domain-containing protein